MSDLAVERRHRRSIDDNAALAVAVGLILRHRGRGQANRVEGSDQVDLDDFAEQVERMRSILRECTARAPDTGAVHQHLHATELRDSFRNRVFHVVLGNHIRGDEERLVANGLGDLRAR